MNLTQLLDRVRSYFSTLNRQRRYKTLSRLDVFDEIFLKKTWTANLKNIPVSGVGSSLNQTITARSTVEFVLKKYQIRSIVDIGCGDFTWMHEMNLEGINYTGVDIVEKLIEENRILYGTPQKTFLTLDICMDKIPTADLVICRDCLVHLSLPEIQMALKNIRESKSGYLLATTFSGVAENKNIVTGLWRPVSLDLPPFDFRKPIFYALEDAQDSGFYKIKKQLGFWKLEGI